MNKVLITGISGFLGSHLADFALKQGTSVVGLVRPASAPPTHLAGKVDLLTGDILDQQAVEGALRQARPDVVFHLAAQSLPVVSWRDPEGTLRANVQGTLNVLEQMRRTGLDCTVVVAGSSAEYGAGPPQGLPISEDSPLLPNSPYGVSKVAADLLARTYATAYRLKVVRVRPFLIIGPRKVGDACSDFAQGIVAIERGQQEALPVGNVEAVRDFLDVADGVRALWLLAVKGAPGQVYNIASGEGHSLGDVLALLQGMARRPVPVEQDPARLRPTDEPVLVGDVSRLRALGWRPEVPLGHTLERILAYWRQAR